MDLQPLNVSEKDFQGALNPFSNLKDDPQSDLFFLQALSEELNYTISHKDNKYKNTHTYTY